MAKTHLVAHGLLFIRRNARIFCKKNGGVFLTEILSSSEGWKLENGLPFGLVIEVSVFAADQLGFVADDVTHHRLGHARTLEPRRGVVLEAVKRPALAKPTADVTFG